ncbi:putative transcription factor interactor and regulator LisH family [Helianthus annuus]|uniref:Putative LIS1 homology motif, SRP40 n=1 Tax=Helianthus annuus TaxID=4232 RepID=A0A251TML9_HELAN|nr:nucleolar and coiled-body phosphoprotein 1 isoform X1 [Helianthus annuus]KAF5787625.1 putative transcription factor interactor and regulator LisH family [Helianthus annuus]KAJ0514831.1 putative transcription factor interactor and regulator LisH family [Helianthus annuus]KAJ0523141.1 putative transcription factor interactor and regulator LisH family [Helianthus annuus]KAJ0530995.1 putative transcription factor interactor and regulator LisH family [Helianthus annuus]KAJ0701218.1 putative tran
MASLTPETKELLLHSVLHYLHRGGFTKTLKRFLSEAQIQDETWKASSVNLEDIYCKYIKDSCQTKDNAVVEPETKEKKKKKNKHELTSGDEVKETKTEAIKKPVEDNTNEDNAVVEPETKAKKKKKNKHELGSGDEVKETKPEAVKKPVDDGTNDLEVNESKKKSKDKKKKSKEQVVDPNEVKEETKSLKKRKRLSDENGHRSDKIETNETVEEAAKENETHKHEKPEMNGGEKIESQKSVKKQRVGSAEPKTVNAFQRVKIEQVEFAHEKLQDNSYWAKDGADIGYGAKAQEVLGQVRGRDFRHEKTKKKRGSYRGGQIDLQSHSIKFNYDDEE